jgi:hypothetical protein
MAVLEGFEAPKPIFRCSGLLGKKRRTATQPDSHRAIVSSDRLQLSCFKLSVTGPTYLALLVGGLGTSTEAQRPLELKCSAWDHIIIEQVVSWRGFDKMHKLSTCLLLAEARQSRNAYTRLSYCTVSRTYFQKT